MSPLQQSRAQPWPHPLDIYDLNPDLSGWVLHVLCFIVPRQMVELGAPAVSVLSFGAVCKKIIRHLTCCQCHSNHFHAHTKAKALWTQPLREGILSRQSEGCQSGLSSFTVREMSATYSDATIPSSRRASPHVIPRMGRPRWGGHTPGVHGGSLGVV